MCLQLNVCHQEVVSFPECTEVIIFSGQAAERLIVQRSMTSHLLLNPHGLGVMLVKTMWLLKYEIFPKVIKYTL